MPIYAYRCDECSFEQDILQKISDPILTDCPSCGKPSFKKQLTAASLGGGGPDFGGMPPCAMGGGCMGGPCG